jgi:hypothetical protein
MSNDERRAGNAHVEFFGTPEDRCGRLNFCVAGAMYRCGAGPALIDQQQCRFFRRSSVAERCLHYRGSLEGHCDCVEAQQEVSRRELPQR